MVDRLRNLVRQCIPAFSDADVEAAYAEFDRPSDLILLRFEIMMWLVTSILGVGWLILPYPVGAYYRTNNVVSCLYLSLGRRMLQRYPRTWQYYNKLAAGWGLHHLLYQSMSLTRVIQLYDDLGLGSGYTLENCHGTADEGYMILWSSLVLVAFSLGGISYPWSIPLFFGAPTIWIISVAQFGCEMAPTRVYKYAAVYFLLCCVVLLGARQREIRSRALFLEQRKLSEELAYMQTWKLGIQKVLATNFDYSGTIDFDLAIWDSSDLHQGSSDLNQVLRAEPGAPRPFHEYGNTVEEQHRLHDFFQQHQERIRETPGLFHGPDRIMTTLVTVDSTINFEVEAIWIPGLLAPAMKSTLTPSGLYWIGLRKLDDFEPYHNEGQDGDTGFSEEIPADGAVQDVCFEPPQVTQENPDEITSLRSLPTTTATGRAFEDFLKVDLKDDEVLKKQIQYVVELGSREGWLIGTEDLQIGTGRILGSGGFGMVIAAEFHGAEVAVKIPKKVRPDGSCSVKLMASIASELRVLRKIRHPNIAMFCGAIIDTTTSELGLVYELVQGTPLEFFINRPPRAPDTISRHKVAMGIASALQYLHAQRPSIIHGDLKPINVIVDRQMMGPRARLIDFGLSRFQTRNAKRLGGTLRWMAPEVRHKSSQPSPSADVYSFGLLLYFIITGKRPGEKLSPSEFKQIVPEMLYSTLCQWTDDVDLLEEARALCKNCLRVEPSSRIGMAGVQTTLSEWSVPLGTDGGIGQSATPQDTSWAAQVARLRKQCHARKDGSTDVPLTAMQDADSAPCQLMLYPRYLITTEDIQKLSLTLLVERWNVLCSADMCCTWHAMIKNLLLIAQSLDQLPCHENTRSSPLNWQCPNCGMLDEKSEDSLQQCEFCQMGYSSESIPTKWQL